MFTFLDIVKRIDMLIIWPIVDYEIIRNGLPFSLDTPRYWFQFYLSAVYALCVFKLRYNKFKNLSFPDPKQLILKKCFFFSVEPHGLNGVYVKEKSVLDKNVRHTCSRILGVKVDWIKKLWFMPFMLVISLI